MLRILFFFGNKDNMNKWFKKLCHGQNTNLTLTLTLTLCLNKIKQSVNSLISLFIN